MMFMAVTVIGPPLGGWLAQRYGFRNMLMAAWGLYLLATGIRIGMSHWAAKHIGVPNHPLRLADLFNNLRTLNGLMVWGGLIVWLIAIYGLLEISIVMSNSLMPLFSEAIGGMNFQQVGWLGAFFGLSTMLANWPGGWLADKHGSGWHCAGFLAGTA
jgi:MFS family permease